MIINLIYGIISKIYNICSKKGLSKIYLPDDFLNNIKENNTILNTKNYKDELRIMSYNIDGLFVHYNLNNYQNIAKFIKYQFLDNNIDVICLQEVWEKSILDLITKDLNNLYIATPSTKLKYYIGENTGLMVISRYEIYLNDFIEFQNCKLCCNMTRKGFQIVDIKYDNKYYSIINTHLQSSFNNIYYQNIAIVQLNQIIEYCRNNKYLIMGDLNLDTQYMKQIISNNITINYNPSLKHYITYPENYEQLDYFLFINNIFKENEIKFHIIKQEYSDHYPIVLTIHI